jgi:AraC-like DNA-binding protein
MKAGKNRPIFEKLRMGAYGEGSLANVCWTPETSDIIGEKVRPHVHSFYEILCIVSGFGSHVVNGERIEAKAGDLFLLAPGSYHDPALLQPTTLWVFIFNLQALDSHGWGGAIHTTSGRTTGASHALLRDLHTEEGKHLHFRIPRSERPEISRIFRSIQIENIEKQVGWDQTISDNLDILLVNLRRRHLKNIPAAGRKFHPVVAQAMDFIDLNFRRQIGLNDIARHVGRSPAYLTDLVHQHTGRPAKAWLSDRRLVEAGSLILTSRKSVEQIADTLGYDSMRHFSHMFKKKYGDSPLQWRSRLAG